MAQTNEGLGTNSAAGASEEWHLTQTLAEDESDTEVAITNWLRGRPRLARLAATTAAVAVKQSYYRLSLSAAGAAFWLVIAVFPAAFAAIMIFGLVVSQEQINDWLSRASRTSPNGMASVVAEQAQQVVQTEPGTLSVGLAVSLALTLWSASAGAYALLRSIRLAYGLAPQSYLAARARGVLATLIAVVALGLLGWVGLYARRAESGLEGFPRFAVSVTIAVLAWGVLLLMVAATFRFAIAIATPARCVIPGAAITTLAVALLVAGVALFGSYATRYQTTYGALSSMVVTLLVLYGLMYATLLAALFNAEWAPLPDREVQEVGAPDQQWQRLAAKLDGAESTQQTNGIQTTIGSPSDTLPQPEDDPTREHNKQIL